MQLVLRRDNCPGKVNLEVSTIQKLIKDMGVEKSKITPEYVE